MAIFNSYFDITRGYDRLNPHFSRRMNKPIPKRFSPMPGGRFSFSGSLGVYRSTIDPQPENGSENGM